jgi:ribosomal protein S18 acetylase RimI-like enzyme
METEIRRINEDEGDLVAELWDRMCREIPDGGSLTDRGRRNIAGCLSMSAWHERSFCRVAVAGGSVVGFVNGRTDTGDGLLPGVSGTLESLYVVPAARNRGISRRLAESAVGWLRERGADVVSTNICIDNDEAQRLWLDLGFQRDVVRLSHYG